METNEAAPYVRSEATAQTQPLPRPARAQAEPEAPLRAVADDAVRSAGALYRAVQGELEQKAHDSPYVLLGVAAGVGFVVGGGLASPLGQTLVRASVRAFGGTVLQTVLNAAAEAVERHGSTSAES